MDGFSANGMASTRAINRTSVIIAGCYWLSTLALFLKLFARGANDANISGMVALTAPWSLVALAFAFNMPSDRLISPETAFIIVPVLCGGLNAVLIVILGSLIHRRIH